MEAINETIQELKNLIRDYAEGKPLKRSSVSSCSETSLNSLKRTPKSAKTRPAPKLSPEKVSQLYGSFTEVRKNRVLNKYNQRKCFNIWKLALLKKLLEEQAEENKSLIQAQKESSYSSNYYTDNYYSNSYYSEPNEKPSYDSPVISENDSDLIMSPISRKNAPDLVILMSSNTGSDKPVTGDKNSDISFKDHKLPKVPSDYNNSESDGVDVKAIHGNQEEEDERGKPKSEKSQTKSYKSDVAYNGKSATDDDFDVNIAVLKNSNSFDEEEDDHFESYFDKKNSSIIKSFNDNEPHEKEVELSFSDNQSSSDHQDPPSPTVQNYRPFSSDTNDGDDEENKYLKDNIVVDKEESDESEEENPESIFNAAYDKEFKNEKTESSSIHPIETDLSPIRRAPPYTSNSGSAYDSSSNLEEGDFGDSEDIAQMLQQYLNKSNISTSSDEEL